MGEDDYQFVKKGATFKAPADGAFVSDYYLEEIVRVRIDNT